MYNGVNRGGRQLHRRRTHEEQDREIDYKSLPNTVGTTHSIRNSQTTNTSIGQRGKSLFSNMAYCD